MIINGVDSSVTAKTTGQTRTPTVDYDTFLQLLVAQLKNQDPTEPMGSTEYVAQLATFSNVEQATQINERLDQLIMMSGLQQAADLVGKTYTSPDGMVTGQVVSARVLNDGVVAILDGGQEVLVQPGSYITL